LLERGLGCTCLNRNRKAAFKIFYDRLIASGKKAKVAFTAVMRKLLVLGNTLVGENQLWEPYRP